MLDEKTLDEVLGLHFHQKYMCEFIYIISVYNGTTMDVVTNTERHNYRSTHY